MAFNVYHNPTTVTIGSISLTGVVAVACGASFSEIHASADGDTHESVARKSTQSTRGSISFVDPTEAASAIGLTGTLSFVWVDAKASTNKTVTITGVSITNWDSQVGRDAASNASVAFIAESSDGTTDPLSIA